MRFPGSVLGAVAAVAMIGCASRPMDAPIPSQQYAYAADGTVGAEVLIAAPDTRYTITPGVDFEGPIAKTTNAMPVYPPQLLAKRLPPVEVIARVIVDREGRVERAVVLEDDGSDPLFAEATLWAIEAWLFSPLRRMEAGVSQPLPFTQDYRLVFRQVNGRAVVESGTSH